MSSDGWMDIKTAPKDGTQVILWGPKWLVVSVGYFDGQYYMQWWSELIGHADTDEYEPTHWQPMPAPPKPTQHPTGDIDE